jgi:TonB family protein
MPPSAPFGQILPCLLLSILIAQAPTQNTAPRSELPRLHLEQDHLNCTAWNVVSPSYPRKARLAHTEGAVKLIMIIAVDGTVADLQAVSGDPLLLDSTITALRQWRFQPTLLNGRPEEVYVALSFTFSIQDPPEPAYLQLTDGKVIRADAVREFTDRIEYTVGRRTFRLSPDSVTDISACDRTAQPPNGCVHGGGPSFNIRAFPLFPASEARPSGSSPMH